MAAPNLPPPPPPPDGQPSSSRTPQPGPSDSACHPNCARVQARQERSRAHQLDAKELLRHYPTIPNEVMNAPSGGIIQMSHPERYLPPSGGHYVIGDTDRVQVPDSLGGARCANCFQPFQQNGACSQGRCPNPCGYCGGRHNPKEPCPMAYNTERSWKRRKFFFHDGVPENLSLFPSRDQFAILKANGYITNNASYDLKRTPNFDFCWLGPRYDLRELSIRSPLLRAQQQQQQRKFATPKSRQKSAPQYTDQEATNAQAMLRTVESMLSSQERMFQQAIDAVSARGQMPPPPPPPPQPQPQPQPQPGRASVVYNFQRGSNVTFDRNSRAGAVTDTPRPTSISEWARNVPQHTNAQTETMRDIRPLRDRMSFPLESRMTYDTQSNAGSSSTQPRYPASNKRERSPSANQGFTASGRKRPLYSHNERRNRIQRSIADATATAPSQGNERRSRLPGAIADVTATAPPEEKDNATTRKTGYTGP